MARPRWTFRAGRRNLCRKRKGVWPAGGIQLDPHRYCKLLDDGHIVDTGQRRPGVSGRNQRVMVAAPHAVS
jgi:hypothetical protein